MGFHPDPLLHRRLPAADRVRLPLAGAADQRRLHDEHGARLELDLRRQPARARHPAGAVAGAGRARRLVHGHALAGLQHRDRGLRRLCRAGRRRAPPHPGARTSCATRWCRRSPVSPCRSAPSSTAPSSPSRCSAIPASARCWSSAVHAGDYGLVLGITTVSIVAVSLAVLLIDLCLSAARPAREGALSDVAHRCATCCASTASSPSGVVLLALVAGLRLPVVLLALSAERQLRRAARPAAVVAHT